MSDENQAEALIIELDRADRAYVPGEPITGTVRWDLPAGPERVTLRLYWQTSGKGTRDVGVAGEETWEFVSMRESRTFSFEGIEGPYSFSGKLITIGWTIEAEAKPMDAYAEASLTLSPTGEEVRL